MIRELFDKQQVACLKHRGAKEIREREPRSESGLRGICVWETSKAEEKRQNGAKQSETIRQFSDQ